MNPVFVAVVVTLFAVFGEACERHGAKCPDYTVVRTNQDYEERRYPSLVWVSVSDDGKTKSNVSRKLIKQLYEYLGGGNEAGMKFDMMVPVRTKKVSNEGFNTYTMAVALAENNIANPPRPSNPRLTVTREPATTYVARSFGGHVRQENVWDTHAKALQEAAATSDDVNTSFYYMCVYDSPWRETDRLNEVWMVKSEN